jgi:hypothetical protein
LPAGHRRHDQLALSAAISRTTIPASWQYIQIRYSGFAIAPGNELSR